MPKKTYKVNFELIESLMLDNGINSFHALAKTTRISHAHLSKSKNKGLLGMEALTKIAKLFKKSASYFLLQNEFANSKYPPLKAIPLLNNIPTNFPKNLPQEEAILGHINLPNMPANVFAIQAKGDNMMPLIREGDYIIFTPQSKAQNGSVVIVINEWGEASAMRYRENHNKISLESDNPEYGKLKSGVKHIVVGKVVEIWRNFKL